MTIRFQSHINNVLLTMPPQRRPGDYVMIYHDPITRKHPEAQAILIKPLITSQPHAEYWRIHFLGRRSTSNGARKSSIQICGRWIARPKEIPPCHANHLSLTPTSTPNCWSPK